VGLAVKDREIVTAINTFRPKIYEQFPSQTSTSPTNVPCCSFGTSKHREDGDEHYEAALLNFRSKVVPSGSWTDVSWDDICGYQDVKDFLCTKFYFPRK